MSLRRSSACGAPACGRGTAVPRTAPKLPESPDRTSLRVRPSHGPSPPLLAVVRPPPRDSGHRTFLRVSCRARLRLSNQLDSCYAGRMSSSATPRVGRASRERLLKAATIEFARYGLAGSRIDRIAASAGVNKAQSYAWFGTKDDLFTLVFAQHLASIAEHVRVDGFHLPDYVVRLYDFYLTDPT